MKTIFIAGVHGVGKGTISSYLSSKYDLKSYSASALIKSEKKAKVDLDKIVLDPHENQMFLKHAIDKLNPSSPLILLDGHFCLNAHEGVFKVPFLTFKTLDLAAIFLITHNPEVIYERLLKRDSKSPSLSSIINLQNEEIYQAKAISSQLKIPLLFSDEGKVHALEDFLSLNYQ